MPVPTGAQNRFCIREVSWVRAVEKWRTFALFVRSGHHSAPASGINVRGGPGSRWGQLFCFIEEKSQSRIHSYVESPL